MIYRLVLAVLTSLAMGARGDVSLSRMFSDNMVLQQQLPVAVWGRADAGEPIVVEFNGHSVKGVAGADGNWSVTLPAMKADASPRKLVVKGKNTIEINNVLIGEVWLCSGQSNMGRPVGEEAARAADFSQIRLINSSGETPRSDGLDKISSWVVCTPQSILKAGDFIDDVKGRRPFSEVGYHFGLKLHQTLNVPVGLIQLNCGGSTAKDWTPLAEVAGTIVYDQRIQKITHNPGLLYWVRMRGMSPFTLRGVVWYQGEDDGRNRKYGEDFSALIQSWRKLWNQPELPFYYAQIAQTTYAGGMLSVWEGQRWVMDHVPFTGMAGSNDIYEGTPNSDFKRRLDPGSGWPLAGGGNPHPTGKPRIAARLADIALSRTYQQGPKIVFGPTYHSHEISGNKVIVRFNHAGSGLATDDQQPPNWFEISDGTRAGNKLKYVKADARIVSGDKIEVSSPEISSPKHVRFGWHTLSRFNLVNKEGLPAVTFRTDTEPF